MRISRPRLLKLTPFTTRRYASNTTTKPTRHIKSKPPPFPTLTHCPPSTCTCAPTPPRSDIDHASPLHGAMTAYQEQILICTGRDDWVSRIEEDSDGDNMAAYLKTSFFGRGAEMNDPFYNVSVLNASFESTAGPTEGGVGGTSVYLLPSFKYVPFLRREGHGGGGGGGGDVRSMLKGWVLPRALSPMYEKTPEMKPDHPEKLLRDESLRENVRGVRDVDEILVLICGHGGRDERCGVYGPLLRTEFEEKLSTVGGWSVGKGAKEVDIAEDHLNEETPQEDQPVTGARVGLISHIGGHKFAGNVILYVPPGMKLEDGEQHPLAGMGVWYGRVEPRHVEGIVRETLGRGKVIEELYRGAIDRERNVVRLDLGGGLTKARASA